MVKTTTTNKYIILDDTGRVLCKTAFDDDAEDKLAFLISTYCMHKHVSPETLTIYASMDDAKSSGIYCKIQQMIDLAGALGQSINHKLTRREAEVGELLAAHAGISNKEIASKLNISERTVKQHVSSVMLKCKVQRRSQVSEQMFGMSVEALSIQ